ncbi:MAG: nucleotidyltransferase domain-containing protein [Deltaproteobacteria bacterium]|nr:nucleotidyltransferase domain-containing protein [Deltaproteobacteria bacterium]
MKSNVDVAVLLVEIADLLEIDGANPFRVRAYRNAANTLRELDTPFLQLKVKKLAGIGDDLAGKITELANTGTTEILVEVRARWPASVRALLTVQGLGPKRTRKLHDELNVKSIEDLRRAVDAGLLKSVAGLGASLEKKLKETLSYAPVVGDGRFALSVAQPIADDFVLFLQGLEGVTRVVAAGSLRRKKATVGDLDIVACAKDGRGVIDLFTRRPAVREVLGAGDTRGSVKLHNGLQIDLRVVEEESFGAALLYFTGSKNHCIELRAAALKLGLKLNEYGVFRDDEKLAGETEEGMYLAVGMPFLTPEQREK